MAIRKSQPRVVLLPFGLFGLTITELECLSVEPVRSAVTGSNLDDLGSIHNYSLLAQCEGNSSILSSGLSGGKKEQSD